MQKSLLFTAAIVALFYSCKNEQPAPAAKPAVIASEKLEKSQGKDCANMSEDHNECAQIKLSWPVVKEGSEALKTAVNGWSDTFLAGLLMAMSENGTTVSRAAAVDSFLNAHTAWIKDAEGSPLTNWIAESADTVLLNNDKYLTLMINAYSFTGGAHGNPTSAVATFDAATGKALAWTDVVTDTAAVKALAEQQFRIAHPELSQTAQGEPAFEFSDTMPFKLADNFGLTDKGIYCHYVHYEVGPYAMGSTEFVIPFEKLGSLYRLKQ